ncbi:3-deoxy-D-manno-octulosonic acid transferase [soil metagenome]
MIWFLYNTLLTLLSPFWLPYVWLKAKRRKEQPNWNERMGDSEIPIDKTKRRIWFHTVSVGEFFAAKPILRELRRIMPEHEIVLSVTTSSGHQTARDSNEGLYDHLIYFPLDIARFQLAAMQRVKPEVVAVMETELWLNFLWAAKTFRAKTLLINGRISNRSYPRSQKIRFYYRTLFKDLDWALMQTEVDAERIRDLGASNVRVLGNCKFDQADESASVDPAFWRSELKLDPAKLTIVVGSTRSEMEEALVIEAIQRVDLDKVQVVHAPRHLERVEALSSSVKAAFGSVALRSKGETGPYLILDTYGELASVYSAADIVIIGGGFDNLGGQNIIQPLALGKPVIHGPHMQNFQEVADQAWEVRATREADNAAQLEFEINSLRHPGLRRLAGEAGRKLIADNLGASARYAKAIKDSLSN